MPDIFKRKWIDLAADLLDSAADHCQDHGCNDWDYPSRWTDAEREEFGRAVEGWKEGDYDTKVSPPDYFVMSFLAGWLRHIAGRMADRGVSGEAAIDADAMARAVPRLRYATASLASIVADLEGLLGGKRRRGDVEVQPDGSREI